MRSADCVDLACLTPHRAAVNYVFGFYGGAAVLGVVAVAMLAVETRGRKMPDSLKDV